MPSSAHRADAKSFLPRQVGGNFFEVSPGTTTATRATPDLTEQVQLSDPPAERHDEKLLREVRETQPPPQLCFVTAGKVFPSPSLRFVCWKNILLV